METLPTVLLRPGEADRVIAGHPWIYHASILRTTGEAPDGAIVQVKDHRQRLLGVGFYNSKSKIRVRLLARQRIPIDADFFRQRIRAAHALRQQQMPHATSYRLVNSESDLLSGLIVDKYEDLLVIQLSALGMDRRKTKIVQILTHHFSPRAIIERTDIPSRKFEGLVGPDSATPEGAIAPPGANAQPLEPTATVLTGELSGPVPVRLNGLTFQTDLTAGHKTGLYLDQQQNYKLVADLVARASATPEGASAPLQVLDCFTFNGAFALHCAAALRRASATPEGASGPLHILGIDQSQPA